MVADAWEGVIKYWSKEQVNIQDGGEQPGTAEILQFSQYQYQHHLHLHKKSHIFVDLILF